MEYRSRYYGIEIKRGSLRFTIYRRYRLVNSTAVEKLWIHPWTGRGKAVDILLYPRTPFCRGTAVDPTSSFIFHIPSAISYTTLYILGYLPVKITVPACLFPNSHSKFKRPSVEKPWKSYGRAVEEEISYPQSQHPRNCHPQERPFFIFPPQRKANRNTFVHTSLSSFLSVEKPWKRRFHIHIHSIESTDLLFTGIYPQVYIHRNLIKKKDHCC